MNGPDIEKRRIKILRFCGSQDNDNELCKNVSLFFMIYHATALPCHRNKATKQEKMFHVS